MGETRLWYAFFLPVAGLLTYLRWNYKWILSFTTLLAAVFIVVNITKPDIHNKTLMPALQSPWFAPHVIIYMFSYAILGAATLVALYYLIRERKIGNPDRLVQMTDELVYAGTACITLGMLMGAIWAKEAWGHYWSWDPKETWAAATWLGYMVYIHYRLKKNCFPQNVHDHLALCFSAAADMLVWCELPSFGTAKHPYLFLITSISSIFWIQLSFVVQNRRFQLKMFNFVLIFGAQVHKIVRKQNEDELDWNKRYLFLSFSNIMLILQD